MADKQATERKPRETETRASVEREKSWEPPQVLLDPTPQDGFVFRWIRTSLMGNADNVNASKRFREGWEPVRAEDHPELMLETDRDSKFTGNIEVGGLLLCKAPEEKMAQRQKHYQDVASQQMQSVDNSFMKENDPRMPLLKPDRTTRTTFGRG